MLTSLVYTGKVCIKLFPEKKKNLPQLPRGPGYTFAFEELQRNKLFPRLICKIEKKISKLAFNMSEIESNFKIELLQIYEPGSC